jgi:hypothetical protein
VHKAETNSIQIPQNKNVPKDDESIASGSTASTDSHMKKRLSADMSKEQVEDLVMKLTIGEMKSKWFDEIFEKVKSERKSTTFNGSGAVILIKSTVVEEHSPTNSTPSSSEPSSPKSNPVNPTPSRQPAAQEPVRENMKKPEPATSPAESKNRPNDPISSSRSSLGTNGSPSTSFASDSTSSNHHQQPLRPKSAPLQTSPPTSKARPSVRFSKSPIILNEDEGPEPRHAVPPRPASRSAIPSEPAKQGPTLSAVDLKWGRLFDERGDPTARLGQVLRGIANYLVGYISITVMLLRLTICRLSNTVLATH